MARTFTRSGGYAALSMPEILASLSPKWRALGALESASDCSPPRAAPLPRASLGHLAALTKTPRDSFVRVHLPLSSSRALRDAMLNARGYLRVGRLLEELDSFAGILAQLHCDDGDVHAAPPLLVTAAFDRVDVLSADTPLPADADLVLEGCVTHVGRTSLNIAMDVLPAGRGARPLLQAATTFVARDAEGRAVGVPRLAPASAQEAALWEAGRSAQEERRLQGSASLLRLPPTAEELAVDRNVYGRVFGGHLMRLAYETAWACGWRATAHAPRFLGMSDVLFRRPVEVGELLTVTAELGFSEGPVFTVLVDIEQERPGAGGSAPAVSNQLSFLFRMEEDGHPAPTFYPASYGSAMKWVSGMRQLREGQLRRRPGVEPVARFPSEW